MPRVHPLSLPALRDWIDLQDVDLLRVSLAPSEERPEDDVRAALNGTDGALLWLYAAEKGTPEILEVLAPWVDPGQHGPHGESPLRVAFGAGNLGTARALLERWGGHEHLFEVDDGTGQDLVHLSVAQGNPAMVALLLDHLANPQQSERALHIALSEQKWGLADTIAVRPEMPEHRVAAAVRRKSPNDQALPLWTVRRETAVLKDSLAEPSSRPSIAHGPARSRL